MSSTRSIIAPPPFAENALTVIPPTPVAGVSYRDPIAGPASSPDGWPYSERVNSAEFNQLCYQWSTLLSIMDKKGVLGWSDLVNYTESAICFGSNGKIYTWLIPSGPANGGAKDPVSEPTYWQEFIPMVFASSAETVAGVITDKAVNPAGLNSARMRRIARAASSAVQTLPGVTLGPDPITPLNVSFTADGGMYFIRAELKTLIDGSGSNVDQIFQTRLRNGTTVLDIGAFNNDGSFASQRFSLGWSGILSGAVALNVVLQRSIASGTLILNADQHAGTNTTGQESYIEVYRMGA